MARLLIHFARFGPYHHARLRAAHDAMSPLGWEVMGLETAGNDATYAWDESSSDASGPRVVTVFPGRVHEEITAAECKRTLHPLLDTLNPDAIAIAGWASADALSCLSWCRKHHRRRIVMSETREADGQRVWWRERIKRYLISRFDGALVGGKSHRDYLVKLGMSADRIRFGYNVVDNAYFEKKTQYYKTQDAREEERGQRSEDGGRNRAERDWQELFATRPDVGPPEGGIKAEIEKDRTWAQMDADGEEAHCQKSGVVGQRSGNSFQLSVVLPKYFLSSNRFIERKNLARLIEAYAAYNPQSTIHKRQSSIANPQSSIWHLCILGDGELKSTLIAQCHALGLNVIESAPWESALTSSLRVDSDAPPAPSSLRGTSRSLLSKTATSLRRFPDSRPPTCDISPQTSDFRPPTSAPRPPTSGSVFFPGFRQIEELPRFYAQAGCFVHPALEEPWGLVLNEAMACGLPILSGSNVGAAEELVDEGFNGWTFDAGDVARIAECMRKIAGQPEERRLAMGAASSRILEERCPTAAFGQGLAKILKE